MSKIKNQKVMRLLVAASIFFQLPSFAITSSQLVTTGENKIYSKDLSGDDMLNMVHQSIEALTGSPEDREVVCATMQRPGNLNAAHAKYLLASQINAWKFVQVCSLMSINGFFKILTWFPRYLFSGLIFDKFDYFFIPNIAPYDPQNEERMYSIIKRYCGFKQSIEDYDAMNENGILYSFLVYPIKFLLKAVFVPINFILGLIFVLVPTSIFNALFWKPDANSKEMIDAFKSMQTSADALAENPNDATNKANYINKKTFLENIREWLIAKYDAAYTIKAVQDLIVNIGNNGDIDLEKGLMAKIQIRTVKPITYSGLDVDEKKIVDSFDSKINFDSLMKNYYLLSQSRPKVRDSQFKDNMVNPYGIAQDRLEKLANTLKCDAKDVYDVMVDGNGDDLADNKTALTNIFNKIDVSTIPYALGFKDKISAFIEAICATKTEKFKTTDPVCTELEEAKKAFDDADKSGLKDEEKKSCANLTEFYNLVVKPLLQTRKDTQPAPQPETGGSVS